MSVLDSLVVRISACHVEGPGSIPGRGETLFTPAAQLSKIWRRLDFLLASCHRMQEARVAQSVER